MMLQSVVDIRGNLESMTGGPVIQYNLGTIVGSFIGAAITIGAIAALGYMVLGAVNWVTSGGDKGKVEKARERIFQSIVGLAVLVATWAIFGIVQYFFGVDILGGIGGGGNNNAGGGGNNTAAVCTVNATAQAGAVGNYCNGANTTMKCVPAGTGGLNYVHWEPCACPPGVSPRAGVTFVSCTATY